ncbi:MAG: hypothetical protein JHC93_08645, partial [Parachlamydiales bacterium]|nr:hypothetical protein [Parachlamydiales bacterium]
QPSFIKSLKPINDQISGKLVNGNGVSKYLLPKSNNYIARFAPNLFKTHSVPPINFAQRGFRHISTYEQNELIQNAQLEMMIIRFKESSKESLDENSNINSKVFPGNHSLAYGLLLDSQLLNPSKVLSSLLKQGVVLDHKECHRGSYYHDVMAYHNTIETKKELLIALINNGCDFTVYGNQKSVLYSTLISSGLEEHVEEVADLLIDSGAKLGFTDCVSGSILHDVIRFGSSCKEKIGAIRSLCKHGIDVNYLNECGDTPLDILSEKNLEDSEMLATELKNWGAVSASEIDPFALTLRMKRYYKDNNHI